MVGILGGVVGTLAVYHQNWGLLVAVLVVAAIYDAGANRI